MNNWLMYWLNRLQKCETRSITYVTCPITQRKWPFWWNTTENSGKYHKASDGGERS